MDGDDYEHDADDVTVARTQTSSVATAIVAGKVVSGMRGQDELRRQDEGTLPGEHGSFDTTGTSCNSDHVVRT